jgi:hypothetical protein
MGGQVEALADWTKALQVDPAIADGPHWLSRFCTKTRQPVTPSRFHSNRRARMCCRTEAGHTSLLIGYPCVVLAVGANQASGFAPTALCAARRSFRLYAECGAGAAAVQLKGACRG